MKLLTKWQTKLLIGRKLQKMRIYRKIKENNDDVLYEYLWSDYQNPYTELIKINKKDLSYKVLKLADGDPNEELAGFYAMRVLSKNNYPAAYTHTAS